MNEVVEAMVGNTDCETIFRFYFMSRRASRKWPSVGFENQRRYALRHCRRPSVSDTGFRASMIAISPRRRHWTLSVIEKKLHRLSPDAKFAISAERNENTEILEIPRRAWLATRSSQDRRHVSNRPPPIYRKPRANATLTLSTVLISRGSEPPHYCYKYDEAIPAAE